MKEISISNVSFVMLVLNKEVICIAPQLDIDVCSRRAGITSVTRYCDHGKNTTFGAVVRSLNR